MKTRLMTILSTVAVLGFVAGAQAEVRVIHASPDAPAVDVIVNDDFMNRPITDLAFTGITPYIFLPSGTYNFKVVPAGADEPVVIDADAMIDEANDYTIIASDVLAEITPLVFVDDNDTVGDAAKVRFIHLSPNAPAVDIALADGGPVLFPGVEFQQSGGYIEVPGGTYDLEARLAGTETVVLSIPGVTLENNTVYTAYAMGLVGADDNPLQAVLSVDATGPNVRVVHASPDAPNVDVVVNDDFGMPAIVDLPFTGVTDYLSVPNATYNFKVVPTGAMDPVVIDADVPLAVRTDYSVIASDFLADITPLVFVDDNTLVYDAARVRFIHLSPDAPAVDIRVADGGPELFDNISFQQASEYLTVAPATYDLEVYVADTNNLVLEVPGVTLTAYTVYTIYAMGSVGDPNLPPLQAVASVDAQDFRLGDINCDGFIHFFDINAFITALSGQAAYEAEYPDCDWLLADIDGDGWVTFDDIAPFVELLGSDG